MIPDRRNTPPWRDGKLASREAYALPTSRDASFIRASGFQSTDDPVCRNPDTLEAVVMTETGLAFAEAAPLFPLVRKIDDVRP